MELFERAAAAGGRLLQVHRLPATGGSDEDAAALVLTFDVGRILVSVDSATAHLVATHLAGAGDIPDGALNASEEEPWWRLLGTPLAGAAESEAGTCLRLDFQLSDAPPRTLALASDGVRLRATLETGS